MKLFSGDPVVLAVASPRLADTFGALPQSAGTWWHRHIAKRIIAQYGKHREAFDEFTRASAWESVLVQVARNMDMHPWTLAYGIPRHVAEAVDIAEPEHFMAVLQLGDVEPHIMRGLVSQNSGYPLEKSYFGVRGGWRDVPTSYEARTRMVRVALEHAQHQLPAAARSEDLDLGYTLMTLGVPFSELSSIQPNSLAACMLHGIPHEYAVPLLQGGIQPDAIVDLHRSGIVLEYALSTVSGA